MKGLKMWFQAMSCKDIPAYLSGAVPIHESTSTVHDELLAILKAICQRALDALVSSFGVTANQWQHKMSLCAYAIISAVLSIPKPIAGRVLTVKAAIRQFDKGAARIKRGLKETGASPERLRQFEQAALQHRKDRDKWL